MLMEGQIGQQRLQSENCPWVKEENNNKAAKKGQGGRKGKGRTESSWGGRSEDAGSRQSSDAQPSQGPRGTKPRVHGQVEAGSCSWRFPHVSGCSFFLPTISRVFSCQLHAIPLLHWH